MSKYQDFLSVVAGLPSGTVFEVTYDWCTAHGLSVNPKCMPSWGKKFKNDCPNHNCSWNTVGTDQHNSYTKN